MTFYDEDAVEMAELEAELIDAAAPYYDQEMADIIADAVEKEIRELQESLLAEAAAEQDYLDQQAEIRATQDAWGVDDDFHN